MHRFRTLFFLLAAWIGLAAAWPIPASARVYVDLNQPAARKMPMAVPDFNPLDRGAAAPDSLTKELPRFLGDGLDMTGLFIILDPRTFLGTGQGAQESGAPVRFKDWLAIGCDLLVTGDFRLSGNDLVLELRLYDVFEQRQVVGKRYTTTFDDRFNVLSRFMNEILLALTGERGVFGTTIAFVGKTNGYKELYTVQLGQPGVRQVTKSRSTTLSPVFSRRGDELAYLSYKTGRPHLYVQGLSDGVERRISIGSDLYLSPCFTAAGQLLVAISQSSATNIHLVDRYGKEKRQVTQGYGISLSPTLSPDGKRMAYVSDQAGHPQIYIMPVEGGEPRRITFEGNYNTEPQWSPRGDRLVYVGKDNGKFIIYTIKPDGTDRQQLTSGDADDTSPSWSPGGRMIVFTSNRLGPSRLFTMTANGDRQRPLTLDFKGEQFDPAWSAAEPD